MMTGMKKSRFVMAMGAAALGLLMSACEGQECIDQFDCQINKGGPGAGKQYACKANVCVVEDAPTPPPPPSPDDAGTQTDAGTEPEPDAGTTEPDSGTQEPVSCANLPHDPKLGTLQLQSGFSALESASLPTGIGAVTVVAGTGSSFAVYGVQSQDKSLYALGTWPNVAASTTPLYPIVPGDVTGTVYLSGYLVNDGAHLLAGYTQAGAGFPGKVASYDLATPSASTYLSAPGNFSAVGLSGAVLLNGLGVEGVSATGVGVYALKTQSSPYQKFRFATFPSTAQNSGFSAVATNGIVALGYALATPTDEDPYAYSNVLHGASPDTYSPALSAGTTLDLTGANTPAIYSGTDLLDAVGFGAGVALVRGGYTDSYESFTREVSRLPLSTTNNGLGVTAGTAQPVLTQSQACTFVVSLAPIGGDLLIGVSDKNGRRLVRLHQETP